MDEQILVWSSSESLRYQLNVRPAGLEEIARMTEKRVAADTNKASRRS